MAKEKTQAPLLSFAFPSFQLIIQCFISSNKPGRYIGCETQNFKCFLLRGLYGTPGSSIGVLTVLLAARGDCQDVSECEGGFPWAGVGK